MLTGNKVTLTPAEIKDKEAVYQWCFHSETTKYHSDHLLILMHRSPPKQSF